VPEGVLLDAAADRVNGVLAQLDRVERVQHQTRFDGLLTQSLEQERFAGA